MGVSHPPVSRRSVGNTSKQPYFHLSACRWSSRAGIQSAIQGEWVFTRRIEDCAKPKAPGVSQAAPKPGLFVKMVILGETQEPPCGTNIVSTSV